MAQSTNLMWAGKPGDEYCEHHSITAEQADKDWKGMFGVTFTECVKQTLEALKLSKTFDANILEIGCSTGTKLDVFSKLGFHNLFGVDLSPKAISICKQHHPNFQVKTVNDYEYSFQDQGVEQFDIAFTSAVLSHIPREERKDFFDKVRKLNVKYFMICCEAVTPTGYSEANFHGWIFRIDDYQRVCDDEFGAENRVFSMPLNYVDKEQWTDSFGMCTHDTISVYRIN